MRVNNIQNTRSEVVSTSRKPVFMSKTSQAVKTLEEVKPLLPQEVIDHFGLNMSAAVKYMGEQSYTPAPDTLGEKLAGYFHNLMVDWETHVDPNKQKSKF